MTLAAAALCLAGLAPAPVDYETLAKPLPEILKDLSPMVGKRLVCDDSVAQDRLCVFATDVDPRNLLDKIVFAVAGTAVEQDGTITVRADPRYDQRLIDRRNLAIDRLHEQWASDIQGPVAFAQGKIDVHELASLVTPDVLKSLPLQGKLVFSRPPAPGARPFPASFPDLSERIEDPRFKIAQWDGMTVTVTAERTYVSIQLEFGLKGGRPIPVHYRHLSHYRDEPGSLLAQWIEPGDDVSRRLSLFRMKEDGDGSVVATGAFEAFAGRPWKDEPLNAIAAPTLVNAARTMEKDLVAYLDDESAARTFPPQAILAFFLLDNNRMEEDGWVVAQVTDPRASRARRADRTRLRDLVVRAKARGYFEFWDVVRYRNAPGAASDNVLRLEAAAIGPVAPQFLPSAVSLDFAAAISALHDDPQAWERATSDAGIPVRMLPSEARELLTAHFKSNSGFAVGTSKSGTNRLSALEAGLDKALPQDASARIVLSDQDWLVGLNEERKYMVVAPLGAHTHSVAQAEVGKLGGSVDAHAALRKFVPCVQREMRLELDVRGFVFRGPGATSMQPVAGVEPTMPEDFQKEFRGRYERSLEEARKRAKGG
jgi:hypothetical protein